MVDISNKALALVLVVAVVVSVGGTLISLNKLDAFTVTGLPVQDATAQLEIDGTLAIEFIVDNVNFGAGYAVDNGSGTTCDITTDGTFNTTGFCFGFNSSTVPFHLRNIGNQVAQVDLSFSESAADFITGTGAALDFYVEDREVGSCSSGLSPAVFTAINNQTICTTFESAPGNDEINIHLRAIIPSDATTGARSNTVTATAT